MSHMYLEQIQAMINAAERVTSLARDEMERVASAVQRGQDTYPAFDREEMARRKAQAARGLLRAVSDWL